MDIFKRTCSLVFITSTFHFFCSSLPPDSSGNWFVHIERDPTQTFLKKGCCVHHRGLVFTCQDDCKPWQVKDKDEHLDNFVDTTVSLILLRQNQRWAPLVFNPLDRFVHVDKCLLDCLEITEQSLLAGFLFKDAKWLKFKGTSFVHLLCT